MEPVNCSDLASQGYTMPQIKQAESLGKCSYGIDTPPGHPLFGTEANLSASASAPKGGIVVLLFGLVAAGFMGYRIYQQRGQSSGNN